MINSIILQATTHNVDVTAVERVAEQLITKAISLGEKIIVAVIIYIIGAWLIRLVRKLIRRLLVRKNVEGAVASFINSLTNTLLKVLLIIVIIGVLGVETTSFAAILAAAGLAIGMAMKDNLANFAGGVMILLNKPFKFNDYIIAQSMEGTVKEIGILYTVLITGDGRTVYMPNGPLSTGNIINNSTQNTRRVDISFNVNYGNNADELKKDIRDIINSNEMILNDPAPFIGVTAVNNGNFDITIRVWALGANYGSLSTELNEDVYRKLSEKGVFTSPYLTVQMTKND